VLDYASPNRHTVDSQSERESPCQAARVAPGALLLSAEDVAVKAARLILSADFVLVAAGAGFSADSGLKVYKDIADIPA
jgi:hypothetical protein